MAITKNLRLTSTNSTVTAGELLTAESECELFRRMNYLKFQANAARCRLDLDDASL